MPKTAEQKRQGECYGYLRCWNQIQVRCPVYTECYTLAGGVRMLERMKAQNKKLRELQTNRNKKSKEE